jgi:hypothetical protein
VNGSTIPAENRIVSSCAACNWHCSAPQTRALHNKKHRPGLNTP